MGQAEDGCDSEMDEGVLSFSGTVSASGLFSATWSFRRARLEPQEQYAAAGAMCNLAATGTCSDSQGSVLQCSAVHSYPGHCSWVATLSASLPSL